MDIKEVKSALPALIQDRITPFIWGSQGIGKTQVVKQVAKSMGFESVIHLMLASQEVGDLIGVQLEQPDGTSKHARPSWFPAEGKHLIFLDELNRAPSEVIQSIFSLLLDGKIHTHQLPPNCALVAAGNYNNNNFVTTEMNDQAFMSRFAHIDFQPTVEEFVVYSESQGNNTVADFISAYPEMLEIKDKKGFDFNQITPDRRTWNDFIGALDKNSSIEDIRYELYMGLVGQTAAAAYITHRKNALERLSGRKILEEYPTVKSKVKKMSGSKNVRLDILNSTVEELFTLMDDRDITDAEMANLKQFVLDIPLEMSMKFFSRLQKSPKIRRRNELLNNSEFVKMFESSKLKKENNNG